jgi:hypothetical protein
MKIDPAGQGSGRVRIVLQVHFARMHCAVANYAERVKRLLNLRIEPIPHEAPNCRIQILVGLSKVGTHELRGVPGEWRLYAVSN